MNNKLIFYVKPTEKCNTKCLHCYNGDVKGDDLSIFRYRKFMDSVAEIMSRNADSTEVEIVIHGGEPTLFGMDNLEKIVRETALALPFVKINYSLQTNMLIYDTDVRDFVKKNTDGIIGTSYSPGIRFLDDEQYYRWLGNLVRVVRDGLKPYLIITLSKEYVKSVTPDKLIDFMVANKIYGFHFEPLTYDGNAKINWEKIYVDYNTYTNWKTEFAREFIHNRIYSVIEKSDVVSKAEAIVSGGFVGCCSRDCYMRVYTINSDGSVGGCPNKSHSEKYGVLEDGFERISTSVVRKMLAAKEKHRRLECLNCDVFQYCNGGCVQTGDCFEGKEFYRLLKDKVFNDTRFSEWVRERSCQAKICV